MIQLKFFACAESSALDVQTNRVSLFHLQEDIAVSSLPVFLGNLAVVVIFTRDPETDPAEAEYKLIIADERQEITRFPLMMNFQEKATCRVLSLLQGLVLPSLGKVTFTVKDSEDKSLDEWMIQLLWAGSASMQPAHQPQPSRPPEASSLVSKGS